MSYDPNRYYHPNFYSWNPGGGGMSPSYWSCPVECRTYHSPPFYNGDPAFPPTYVGPDPFMSASTYHNPGPMPGKDRTIENRNDTSNKSGVYFGRTPDEWITHTGFLVNEGLEDVKRGINATHILQEFILMGVLVGKGYTPEKAYKTVEDWERTGASKLLQQSKNM
ncbi:hypothetical protein RKD55_001489 [Rossellomorea marisflavi]